MKSAKIPFDLRHAPLAPASRTQMVTVFKSRSRTGLVSRREGDESDFEQIFELHRISLNGHRTNYDRANE